MIHDVDEARRTLIKRATPSTAPTSSWCSKAEHTGGAGRNSPTVDVDRYDIHEDPSGGPTVPSTSGTTRGVPPPNIQRLRTARRAAP
jgi:hypothetical protein